MPYLLPQYTDDEYDCIVIRVPKERNHRAAFWGALDELGYWWNWERDKSKAGAIVARGWRERVYDARDAWLSGCGVVTTVQLTNCTIQYSDCGGNLIDLVSVVKNSPDCAWDASSGTLRGTTPSLLVTDFSTSLPPNAPLVSRYSANTDVQSRTVAELWAGHDGTDAQRQGNLSIVAYGHGGNATILSAAHSSKPELSFFGAPPLPRQTVSGTTNGNQAAFDLLQRLDAIGLVDSSSVTLGTPPVGGGGNDISNIAINGCSLEITMKDGTIHSVDISSCAQSVVNENIGRIGTATECNKDAIFAGALQVVRYMNEEIQDAFAAASTSDDLAENVGNFLDIFPFIEELFPLDDVVELVTSYFQQQVDEYNATYDLNFEYAVACKILCYVVENYCVFTMDIAQRAFRWSHESGNWGRAGVVFNQAGIVVDSALRDVFTTVTGQLSFTEWANAMLRWYRVGLANPDAGHTEICGDCVDRLPCDQEVRLDESFLPTYVRVVYGEHIGGVGVGASRTVNDDGTVHNVAEVETTELDVQNVKSVRARIVFDKGNTGDESVPANGLRRLIRVWVNDVLVFERWAAQLSSDEFEIFAPDYSLINWPQVVESVRVQLISDAYEPFSGSATIRFIRLECG